MSVLYWSCFFGQKVQRTNASSLYAIKCCDIESALAVPPNPCARSPLRLLLVHTTLRSSVVGAASLHFKMDKCSNKTSSIRPHANFCMNLFCIYAVRLRSEGCYWLPDELRVWSLVQQLVQRPAGWGQMSSCLVLTGDNSVAVVPAHVRPCTGLLAAHLHSAHLACRDVDTILMTFGFPSGVLSTIDLHRHAVYGYD